MIMISKFLFKLSNFCIIIFFLTKLLILGILFSIPVNAAFVAKPLILGILPSILAILFSNSALSVSYLVFKTNALVSIPLTLATNLSDKVFLTTSFFYYITKFT